MKVVRDDTRAAVILEWTFGKLPNQPYSGFVIIDGVRPVAAFMVNEWNGGSLHLTATAKAPLTIGAARQVARIIFVELNAARVTAVTHETNSHAIRALGKLGFERECVAEDHFGEGVNGVVFKLLRKRQKLTRL
jgi:ribosomal protein S18 acetylase RimI-like enzyme